MSARTHVIAGYFMWTKEGLRWERESRRFPLQGTVDAQGRHLGYGQQEEAKIRQTLL